MLTYIFNKYVTIQGKIVMKPQNIHTNMHLLAQEVNIYENN